MDTTPCEFAPIGLCDTPEHQVPTADNYGLLPVGAVLVGIGTVTGRTLTAYTVDRLEGAPGSEFVPFAHVHPLKAVEPLVVLG